MKNTQVILTTPPSSGKDALIPLSIPEISLTKVQDKENSEEISFGIKDIGISIVEQLPDGVTSKSSLNSPSLSLTVWKMMSC